MSEAATSNENTVQPVLLNNGGESAVHGFSQAPDVSPVVKGVQAASENERSPSIQAASQNEQKPPPENVLDENLLQLQLLRILTRGLSENESKPTSSDDKEIRALRRKLFGLTKPETGVNNRFDCEQKYPEDQPGEELGPHARVWSIYLDEAETYDRERVDGWKETADVLLVFAGLFSGVITTFVSQASQSLQQDNTQVSASLLSEIAQLLRAQYSGTPINNIPNSSLTSTSPFTPSTNALLVNGLWFTSLAITLCTALFAVLSKQWLYYYLSSISGTPREQAMARQFRLQGFELWKVGAIIDLLPILLHLAVGVFLAGIIILLFPMDIRVAWTIIAITGVTYILYFVSVILPIRYPGCPYTTSLTIYIGVLFFFLPKIFHWISAVPGKVLHRERTPQLRTEMSPKTSFVKISSLFHQIGRFLRCSYVLVQRAFRAFNQLVGCLIRLTLGRFISTIPKFTDWREENIKKAVANAAALDLKALYWLYKTSSATSVPRIIARCAFMHRNVTGRFELGIPDNSLILEVNETNVVDVRHGLCADILSRAWNYWSLLPSILNVEFEGQLDKAEYQCYSRIANDVINVNYSQILKNAIEDDTLKLPVAMWQCFLARASGDDTVAARILTFIFNLQENVFKWRPTSTPDSTHGTDPYASKWRPASTHSKGPVSLQTMLAKDVYESRKWKFDYLFRYFGHGNPDYSSKGKSFEIRYLLLVSAYRNLTSDQPLITGKELSHNFKPLHLLFQDFSSWVLYNHPHVSFEQYFAFFIDICCADAFWSEDMDDGRFWAMACLDRIWESMDTDVVKHFPFTECDDLSPIYRWCSRDLVSVSSWDTTSMIITLLFMPQNRDSLCTLLLNDPNAVFRLKDCFKNIWHFSVHSRLSSLQRKYMCQNLMDILESVNPGVPLFTILYNSSVLVRLWELLVFGKWDAKKFLLIVKSKLDQKRLDELYAAMNEQVQLKAQLEAQFEARRNEYLASGALVRVVNRSPGRTVGDLAASAREFGQSIGVCQLQPSVENQSTEEKNHDSEERAQSEEPNGNERPNNSMVHRMKKVFPFGQR